MPTHGGARNRSGPPKDPNSGRSDRAGLTLSELPSGGYTGRIPKFPLPARRVYRWEFEDKRRFQVLDTESTQDVNERELEMWKWAWRTPQAAAWARPSEAWRLPTVALWIRTFVICEGSEATAADKGSLHRFADQIGMTPAGLIENGWTISADAVAAKRTARRTPAKKASARDRFKVVSGGSGS